MGTTRKDRQRRTRDGLLGAANALIASGGIGAASIRGICEGAGFTQGAFYSNFASKDDLLLELLEAQIGEEVLILGELIDGIGGYEETLAALAGRFAELAAEPEWSLLAIELQLHAQRDPAFAARYNDSKARTHAAFARLLEILIDRHGLTSALPPRQLAIGLHALWSGLVIEGTVEGALSRSDMHLAFFKAMIHRGAGTG
jgi:AcrR family transcriptional regulator